MHKILEEHGFPAPDDVTFLTPERSAARAIAHIERNELNGTHKWVSEDAVAKLLEVECQAVADGDMTMVRRTLAAQLRVLERLYDHLLDRAMAMGPSMMYYDTYMKLAFRAQTQLNRTVALLQRFTVMDQRERKQASKISGRTPVPSKTVPSAFQRGVEPAPMTPKQREPDLAAAGLHG